MNIISLLPVMAFFVFLNLYTGLHGFVFFRSIKHKIVSCAPAHVYRPPDWLYWIVFLSAAVIYAGIRFEFGRRSLFGLADAYWGMIMFFPLFAALDVVYIVRFVMRHVIRLVRGADKPAPASGFWGPSFTFVSHIIIIVIVASLAVYGLWRARSPVLVEYHITTEKPLPDGKLEAILVSDIHLGAMIGGKELGRMVSKINSLEGDIVFIAGDILDRDLAVWEQENVGAEFSRLKAPLGVWAVPGNHDYYGGHITELGEKLAACGIILLNDETVETGGFYLAGRKDLAVRRWGDDRETLEQLLYGLDRNRLIVVMDHQPVNLKEGEDAGIDLQVSGHTHRGQIWPGSIITARLYENHYGLLYKGNSAFVVSSGYGTWGPPLRIGADPEIVRIVLKN